MSETMTRADLSALLDSYHQLAARIVAAEVACCTAQASAEAADRAAGDAVVGGDAEAMRRMDAKADAARNALAKARRDHAALQRAHDALRPEIEAAVAAGRMALRAAVDELIRAAEVRYKAAATKAAQALSEAVSIGFATGHPDAGLLCMLEIPSSFLAGDAPLRAVQPGQEPPPLPRAATGLVEAASVLRAADRLMVPAVVL